MHKQQPSLCLPLEFMLNKIHCLFMFLHQYLIKNYCHTMQCKIELGTFSVFKIDQVLSLDNAASLGHRVALSTSSFQSERKIF